MPPSTKPRPSSTLPRPPLQISPSTVIADTAIITGLHPITIGPNTVIHPRAKIISTYSPVTIGEGCIVSEKCIVGLGSLPASESEGEDEADAVTEIVLLDDDVVLEPGASIEGRVGRGSRIEAGAKIGVGAVVGEYCKIAPLYVVAARERLENYEVVFGLNQRRKEKPGLERLRKITHDKELQVLRRLIPMNLAKWQTVESS